jgi:hypothetical protein
MLNETTDLFTTENTENTEEEKLKGHFRDALASVSRRRHGALDRYSLPSVFSVFSVVTISR